jgi:hypothetical protein
MKLFGISPNPVVVDQDQTVLNDLMEMQGLNFIRLKLCHSKVLGAGYQCITLDILRTGTL